jgi:hypothetical protein
MLKRDLHKPLDRVALLLKVPLWNVEAIDFIFPTIVEECAGPLNAGLRLVEMKVIIPERTPKNVPASTRIGPVVEANEKVVNKPVAVSVSKL